MVKNLVYIPNSPAIGLMGLDAFLKAKDSELAYYEKIKVHFPALLKKIASEKPHAVIFTDTSARPFHILAANLWKGLGLGKKPMFRLVDPMSANVTEWATRNKLRGKKVVVFEEYVFGGTSLENVSHYLRKAGAEVVPTAFTVNPRAEWKISTMPVHFAQKASKSAPWWLVVEDAQFKEHSFKFPRIKTGNALTSGEHLKLPGVKRDYAKRLSVGMKDLAREILRERK